MKHYFISYAHLKGFGNCSISQSKEIRSIQDIKKISKEIEENNKDISNVVILNYIKLKNDKHI